MSVSVTDIVAQAMRDGSLYGARPATASRTLTVNGKRRVRIRLQADVFGALYAPEDVTPFYPDLRAAIMDALAPYRR